MQASLGYLLDVVLRPFDISYEGKDSPTIRFNNVYLLTGQDEFLPKRIYVGYTSQLPSAPPEIDSPILFLCIEDKKVPKAYTNKENIILLLCPKNTSLLDLFNHINRLFSESSASTDELWTFLNMIATSATFTQLVTQVTSIMGCSSAILSQGGKILGFCQKEDQEPSKTWELSIKNRYYPYSDAVSRLNSGTLTIYDTEIRKIITSPDKYPAQGDAFFPILSEDISREVLGYLYFSYTDLDQFIYKLYAIQFVAYAMSFRMWRYINSPSSTNSTLCFMLRDIISGSLTNDEDILSRMENIKIPNLPYNHLIVVYSSAMDGKFHSWPHLKTVFSQIFPNDVLFTYNGDILILLSSKNPDLLPEEKLEALSKQLEEQGCYAGISACFDQVDRSLKNYYVRSTAAARMARSYNLEKRYASYEDVAMLHFVQYGASMENMKDLCDPRILRLAAYDRAHSSNYIYTLQCYWQFNQNIQKTCDHLFIHRNTLFYRLKKIKEISGLDFSNTKHMVLFNLSLSILTTLGDIPYTEFPVLPSDSEPDDESEII